MDPCLCCAALCGERFEIWPAAKVFGRADEAQPQAGVLLVVHKYIYIYVKQICMMLLVNVRGCTSIHIYKYVVLVVDFTV